MNDLNLHLKKIKKQKKCKENPKQKKVEVNEIGSRKTIEKMNKTKNWFTDKFNKTDKLIYTQTDQEEGKHPTNYQC